MKDGHLRTYDAWATDEHGKPQTWEQYMSKKKGVVASVKEMPTFAKPNLRELAREMYQNDDVRIDDDAMEARADDGSWVSAWVWVSDRAKGETA